jgi:methyl-accepting chemotaxis protein
VAFLFEAIRPLSMKNLSIAHRILVMIAVSIVSLLAVGAAGLYVANRSGDSLALLKDDSLASVRTLANARQAFMQMRTIVYAHILAVDDDGKYIAAKNFDQKAAELAKLLESYGALVSDDADRRLLGQNAANMKAYVDAMKGKLFPLSRANDMGGVRALIFTDIAPLAAGTEKGFDEHMSHNEALAEKAAQAAISDTLAGELAALAVIVAGVLAVGVIGFFLLRNIRAAVGQIQSMVAQVESNLDFTVRATVKNKDEIGMTALALNRLLEKLQANLRSIASGAQSVASAASLMATTSSQVATASQQQSEAASGVAATVEQMTVSVNHVSDRAEQAERTSSESGALAVSGEAVIGKTTADIQDIAATVHEAAGLIHGLERHSQQISSVVEVIKEVADQTNLLALNAAIEAARAGEQGRGFSVVADEVRKLAERTTASTREIAATIETMRLGAENAVACMQSAVGKVGEGVSRAGEANESIRQIGEHSRQTVAMVEEIASAIREQGAATNNIAAQVEHIAQMSEESSAAAGNSAEAARDLDRLAAEMQRIVSAYRL